MGLLICFVIVPHFAQNCANDSTIELVSATIYNPTNSSIELNATMKLENNGMFSAELHDGIADVYNDGYKLGTMTMASIQIIGNQITIVNISSQLKITNITQFQISCRRNLNGHDDIWFLKSRHKLTMKIGYLSLHTYVELKKDLLMLGSNIENFITNNITILNATNDSIYILTDISFALSSNGIINYLMPPQILNVYVDNMLIGYSQVSKMELKSNTINYFNSTLFIVKITNDNRKTVENFFSLYTMGVSQQALLVGPCNSDGLVINNVINKYVTISSNIQPLAFGSLLTKETIEGWRIDINNTDDNNETNIMKKTIRGGYANMLNPFNVDLKIINLNAKTYFNDFIRYNVTISKLLKKQKFQCYPNKTNEYSLLSIDHGIYKNNYSKTTVQIPSNSKVTYFAIANPLSKADSDDTCFGFLPFSCCYATLTTAYICSKNPQLKSNIKNELIESYISTRLDANITVIINDRLELNLKYAQDFMPVYFGYEVYAGFIGDLEVNCKDFEFY